MSDNARDQAKAQLSSVRAMVAALNCDYDRLEELREERQPFVAGWNMVGYMPDSEPCQFADFTDARDHIAEELRERAEQCQEEAESHSETGDEAAAAVELERAARFEEAADNVETETGTFSFTLEGRAFWVSDAPNGGLSEEEAAELAELEEAADDCEDEDEARRRIEDDALSVEIRSDWETPGARLSASEFRILLCTGGPHVEIVGDLNRHNEPESARLLYQDWFEGKQEYACDSDEVADLIQYASVFYFGE